MDVNIAPFACIPFSTIIHVAADLSYSSFLIFCYSLAYCNFQSLEQTHFGRNHWIEQIVIIYLKKLDYDLGLKCLFCNTLWWYDYICYVYSLFYLYVSGFTGPQLPSTVFTWGTIAVLPFYTLMVLAPKSELVRFFLHLW